MAFVTVEPARLSPAIWHSALTVGLCRGLADFFKQGSSPASRRQWRGCLFEEVQQAAAKGQAVNALCQMTGLSRAGFYRWRVPRQATPVEMEMRDQMQKVALESPAYGYRRITAELQQRGFDGQPQARAADDARGQSALRAAARLRGHHRLAAQPAGLPEPGRRDQAHGDQPALGRRHHLHPPAYGVRVPGGGAGCILAAGDRLGAGPNAGSRAGGDGACAWR